MNKETSNKISNISNTQEISEEELSEVEEQDTKAKSGKYTILLILGIILIFASIFLYAQYVNNKQPLTIDDYHKLNLEGKETENNYVYNGYSFVKFDGLWYTQIQDVQGIVYDISLRFSPREIEDIPIDVDLFMIDAKKFPEIYMTIDPYTNDATYQTLAAAELSLNLVRAFGIIPVAACTRQDNNTCLTRDIIDCDYKHAPIIKLLESDNFQVTQLDNCYTIEGKGLDFLKPIDRFIYKTYGIMP